RPEHAAREALQPPGVAGRHQQPPPALTPAPGSAIGTRGQNWHHLLDPTLAVWFSGIAPRDLEARMRPWIFVLSTLLFPAFAACDAGPTPGDTAADPGVEVPADPAPAAEAPLPGAPSTPVF